MPWTKQRRSSASVSRSCLLFICTIYLVIDSSLWSTWDMICPFTCRGLHLSAENRFPFNCSLFSIHQRQRHRGCAGQRGHRGVQVNKEAATFLECSVAFIYVLFLPVSASQGLFWQVLFCKLFFILFLLRKSQGKRSLSENFWTDDS